MPTTERIFAADDIVELDDNEMLQNDQLVKPSKIHVQPLHADDLLYESKKIDPSAGN